MSKKTDAELTECVSRLELLAQFVGSGTVPAKDIASVLSGTKDINERIVKIPPVPVEAENGVPPS